MPPANQLLRVQALALAQAGVPSDGSVTSTKYGVGSITSNTIFGAAVVTSDKIVSVANTQITGNIISSQITSVANTQVTGLVTSSQLAPTAQFVGMKNRIINGAMVIDQRNAGGSISMTTSSYSVDRYRCYAAVTSKMTVQQNAGSVTPPVGFTNYMGFTTSSGYSLGSTERFITYQGIEGYKIGRAHV